VGWVDTHTEMVQVSVVLIAGSAFAVSLIDPRRAWLWAALIGLAVPASHALVRLSSAQPSLFGALSLPYPVDSYASTFLALIPAAVGAGCGALARALVRRDRARAQG